MGTQHDLTKPFEQNRSRLRAVAYRMLGSLSDADDAVQEAWLRLSRSDTSEVGNLDGWLTTVVARVCLDVLRSRKSRREEPLVGQEPEPVPGPESEALMADSVGLALLVVLETLEPAERLAFVLHDMFAVPFDEIAPIVGRTSDAARQLASRARRRVQGAPAPESDLASQREVVAAFLAALRRADFDGLLAVLDPDVLVHADLPAGGTREIRGALKWAKGAVAFSQNAAVDVASVQLALVDGSVGLVLAPLGKLSRALRCTVTGGKIVAIDIIVHPVRLAALELAVL